MPTSMGEVKCHKCAGWINPFDKYCRFCGEKQKSIKFDLPSDDEFNALQQDVLDLQLEGTYLGTHI